MGAGMLGGARPVVVGLLVAAWAGPSAAASFHYASSSNRIYVEGGGSATLSDIKAALPTAPLDLVSDSPKVWLLRANLQVIDGTELDLRGTSLTGGDVDELRMQSNNDGSGFVHITADYGVVYVDSTKITSWDTVAGAPDAEYANGRAYINVRSSLDADGVTPRESRMDLISSEIQYLGYNAAESYGLVWKVNGYTGSNPEIFDQVQVWGDIDHSHIHHNYYGVYTFGHQDGYWAFNEVDHNVGYGFDPHDDTDNLRISDNVVHDNGNHGIIASKRCDHIQIVNNQSYNNHGNGIMLHRSSNDGFVENNQSHDNTDSGIAIFGTARSYIKTNTLLNNANAGIRMSMGASSSTVIGNEIGGSGNYGFYFYKGSDTPEPGDDGRPKYNVFQSNTVHDVGADGIKMSDSDHNQFIGNTFTRVGGKFTFTTSNQTELTGNKVPSNVVLTLSGNSTIPSIVTVRTQNTTNVSIADASSKVLFRDDSRYVFDADDDVFNGITPSSSLLTLTQALTGGTSTVIRRSFTATPTGTNVYVNPTVWTADSRAWQARITVAGGSVKYVMGGLTPGVHYVVKVGSSTVGTFTATASGQISFTSKPTTTSTLTYTVDPA